MVAQLGVFPLGLLIVHTGLVFTMFRGLSCKGYVVGLERVKGLFYCLVESLDGNMALSCAGLLGNMLDPPPLLLLFS